MLLLLAALLTGVASRGQIASPTSAGVVKVGSGLAIDATGALSPAASFSSALLIVDFNSLGAGRGSSHEITSSTDFAPGPFFYTTANSLAATFPSATFTKRNFSVSGRRTPTMISQMSQVTSMFNPAAYDRQIVIGGEGTNDIADGGATALTAYNNLVTYYKGIRAKGGLVVSTTLLPRTTFFQSGISAATFKVRADSVNMLLRANFLQYSDVLADIATISGITYPDGTHPDDAGYVLIGNYIATKVAPLLRTGFNPQSIPFLLAGTTPVTTTPASGTTTVLLLRGQGSNNSTTITDEAGHPMTANNTAKISTAQFKFGSSSIALDGAANTHVSTPSSSDFDMGSGDFTMEAWIYKTSNGTGFPGLFARGDNTQNQWVLCWPNAGARLEFYVSQVSNSTSSSYIAQGLNTTTDTPLNQWVHIALVRYNGATKLYQNGALIGTATTNTPLETVTTGKPLRVGFLPAVGQAQDTGDRFVGYIHPWITKGARYTTAPFTPPASF
jgi:lysophospholipase L1-like esterase